MKAKVIRLLPGYGDYLVLGETVTVAPARYTTNCFNVKRSDGQIVLAVPSEYLEIEEIK